jgi:hypothetical protein
VKLADLLLGGLVIGMATGLGIHYNFIPIAAVWLLAIPVVLAVLHHKGLNLHEYATIRDAEPDYPEKLAAIEYINTQLDAADYQWQLDEQQPEKIHYRVRDYEYFGDKQGVEVGLIGRGHKKGREDEHTVRVVWDWTRDHARAVDGETYSGDTRTDPFGNYDPTVVQHGVQTLQQTRSRNRRGTRFTLVRTRGNRMTPATRGIRSERPS